VKDIEAVKGASILVKNCAVQLGGLVSILEVGGEPHEQAATVQKASDIAALALSELEPVVRKLARKPRKVGGK
jgi:hypothetical protein